MSITTRTVTNVAPPRDPGGPAKVMTLADLVQFTRDCVAAGLDPLSVPQVDITWTGKIKKITATSQVETNG